MICEAEIMEIFEDTWDRFIIMVWQWHTPPPGALAKRAYESINLRGVHLDGRMSREMFESMLRFAVENDYYFYVDHAAGKGDLYLNREEWRRFYENYKLDRKRPVRFRCLRDPELMKRMKSELEIHITRAKEGKAVAYAFDDEISITSFTNPCDLCWCDRCMESFRRWLRERYGSVKALNVEWETSYRDFDEAEPLGVDDLLSVHSLPFDKWNLSRWADHRTFMDDVFAEVLAELRRYANSLDLTRPAGFVGAQAPAAYGGYDYAKLCRSVQWMETCPQSDEIVRSFFKGKPRASPTFFSSLNPAVDKWFLWFYFCHGCRGSICWPEADGKYWFEDDEVLAQIRMLKETFAELQWELGELLIGASFDPDPIALYYSHPSIQISWFMDIQPHGRWWVNRSSGLNDLNATDILNRWAWQKLLEDSGFQYEYVSYLDVLEGKGKLERYKVLILPRTLALSEKEAEAIRRFVQSGGLLIADYLPGVFDEHCKGREKGALDELFGVERDPSKGVLNGKTVAEVNGELFRRPLKERLMYDGALRWGKFVLYERGLKPKGAKAEAEIGGSAVMLRRKYGEGETVYMNITPLPYLLDRLTTEGAVYRELLSNVLSRVGLKPRVRIELQTDETIPVETLFWSKNDKRYLCIVVNAFRGEGIDGVGAEGLVRDRRVRIKLRFSKPTRNLRNIRTGKRLGDGVEFADELNLCEANIYEFEAGGEHRWIKQL